MDSVSMSHLTHPPLPPANTGDQLQHPGSLSCIRQLAESARIHKELADLQVTINFEKYLQNHTKYVLYKVI